MKRWIWLLLIVLVLAGCGGGGGGGTANVTLSGTVVWLRSGGAPSPAASVQAGSATVFSNTSDGSFSVSAPSGTSEVLVVYQAVGGSPTSFRFSFAAATADRDLGDLVIGPEKINVAGTVLDSATGSPLSGATVTLGGRTATSLANGTFTLSDVAYDSASPNAFLNLAGLARATNYFAQVFNPVSGPIGGVATLDDLYLTADSGIDPPGLPFTITGQVGPADAAAGTVVQLFAGSTLVRQTVVNATRQYGFWIEPGTYTLRFSNPTNGRTAPDQSVTLTSPTDVARRDATLQ
jgi:hypothetical protein